MKHATIITLLFLAVTAFAQTNTAFTYQGRLTDTSTLANGAYDLQFALFDAASDGAQQGANVTLSNVSVTNGIFTVALDFGSAPFATGAPRFLQIGVRPGGGSGTFTLLTPRQALAPTPYAIRSQSAATADTATNATNATNATTATNANQLGGVDANQYVTGSVVRNVNGLSGNITLVAGANVTLTPSGDTLTIAATGGTGSFIQNTTTPQATSNFNISGDGTAGGTLTAATVTGGTLNAITQFSLNGARFLSGPGNSNLFAGGGAGATNVGAFNSFFGARAGQFNLTGSGNVFLGNDTGLNNSSGNSNTLIGSGANVSANGLSFATAIGSLATVSASNTIAIGRAVDTALLPPATRIGAVPLSAAGTTLTLGGADDTVTVPGTFSLPGTLSLNVIDAQTGYNLGGSRILGNGGGSTNLFVGIAAGANTTINNNNTFLGTLTGNVNTIGTNNTALGAGANFTQNSLQFATALGAGATVNSSNTIALGRSDGSDTVRVPGLLLVGNTLLASGVIRVSFLGTAGSTQLCRNANNDIATCSSSLRYKTALSPYRHGLDFIQRLQPISFTWKDGGMRDLGFGAEEVAKVDPLLAIYNKEGQVEGVKYDRLSALLVNAVKEQQAQLEAQQQQIAELKAQLTALAAQLSQPKAADQR